MKAVSSWSFAPYTPLHRPERARGPYVTRLAPFAGGFRADFINNAAPGSLHTVRCGKRDGELTMTREAADHAVFEGLEDGADYRFTVTDGEGRSVSRLVRPGEAPGAVINYLHPEDPEYAFSGSYLCSPSLVRLPSGTLISSMDVFRGEAAQNLTLLFSSPDRGATWRYLTELFPCFWGKLFVAKGELYMLGVSRECGDLLIGRSLDEGRTWSAPTPLVRGSSLTREPGVQRGPMPVLEHEGRLWTDFQYGTWTENYFATGILSADLSGDLLAPETWTVSELFDPDGSPVERPGALEGSVVAGPDGRLYDLLRYQRGKALLLSIDKDRPDRAPEYEAIIDCPTVDSKFDVICDPVSRQWLALVSYPASIPWTRRNLLSLIRSEDLRTWQFVRHVIDRSWMDPDTTAFQYVSFLIDGDDLLFQSRTALNGAHNFHDANLATFHVLKNFRRDL
ncbi:MAG: exo-alpha-sialidase [Abditibacteriota bacterium]|nr:exo-alpha-sialidase [Abditibacteriota bacterium]